MRWFVPKDKRLHFAVCFVISVGLMVLFRLIGSPMVASALAAWLTAIGAGLGKEWGDKCAEHNYWSWGDVAADAVGATFGMMVGLLAWLA